MKTIQNRGMLSRKKGKRDKSLKDRNEKFRGIRGGSRVWKG